MISSALYFPLPIRIDVIVTIYYLRFPYHIFELSLQCGL